MDVTEVTRLLGASNRGDRDAFDRVFSLVYDELRRMARIRRRQRFNATLSTTALVHEVYLKLADAELEISDRHHFLALSARAMRQVVVDYARERSARKRGGDEVFLTLDGAVDLPRIDVEAQATTVLSIHDALRRLAEVDERAAEVVELRFFGGLSVEETAEVLGVSTPTVKRDARAARAFIGRQLGSLPPPAPRGGA